LTFKLHWPSGRLGVDDLSTLGESDRSRVYLDPRIASADQWMLKVKRMSSTYAWDDFVRVLNARGQSWTVERLCRSVGKFVAEKMADSELLERSPPRLQNDQLMTLVAAIAATNPDLSAWDIAAKRELTLRGGIEWNASSREPKLDKAKKLGVV
jgi:hypothetical protein